MNLRHVLALGLGVAVLAGAARAADWPCYLGPNRDLISAEKGLTLWSGGQAKVLWKKSVGQGHSSVAVVGKRLYTQGGGAVWCLEAETGEVVWTCPPAQGGRSRGGETTATPTVADGQVFALNPNKTFVCIDAETGKVQWSKNVSEFGVRQGGWPLSGSPLVMGDNVIMDLGVVFVLNRKSGQLVKKMGAETAGYSSARVFARGSEKLTTSFDAAGLSIYAMETGKQIADFPWETAHKVNAATPVISGEKIFISSGYGRGCALLQLEGSSLKKVWENKELNNHCQTSVLLDGCLYGVHGQQGQSGSLKCLDFETGKVKWDQKGLKVGGGLMMADGKLFVMVDGGDLLVAEASPAGFKQLARATLLSGTCWTVPVVANGRVFCRSQKGELVAVDLK